MEEKRSTIQENEKQEIKSSYERVLKGERKRFEKGFFEGEDGRERAKICFREMLKKIGSLENVKQAYDLFASEAGTRVLEDYKLRSAGRNLYAFPIDFLHQSLPEAERNNDYYRKVRMELLLEAQRRRTARTTSVA